ncbi:MAG: hypothetical protein HOC24_06165 [Deltaproteobacteria bacterium]|nr:hypothetical protein [Deltaproteobacteria bacterium]
MDSQKKTRTGILQFTNENVCPGKIVDLGQELHPLQLRICFLFGSHNSHYLLRAKMPL